MSRVPITALAGLLMAGCVRDEPRNTTDTPASADSHISIQQTSDARAVGSSASSAKLSVEIWRVEGDYGPIYRVDVSPDGRRILAATGRKGPPETGVVLLIDSVTGELLREFMGHDAAIGCVAFTPDGKCFLTGSWDCKIMMWDIETGQVVKSYIGHQWPVLTLAISDDGSRVLSGSDGIRLWDLETTDILRHFTGHSKTVWSVGFSPDGTRAVSGSWDETVRLWSLESGTEIMQFRGHAGRVKGVEFSPDGRLVASCSTGDEIVRLWDLSSGELVQTSASGTQLLTNDG